MLLRSGTARQSRNPPRPNYVSEMKDALSEAYDKYIAGIRAASENLRNLEKSG